MVGRRHGKAVWIAYLSQARLKRTTLEHVWFQSLTGPASSRAVLAIKREPLRSCSHDLARGMAEHLHSVALPRLVRDGAESRGLALGGQAALESGSHGHADEGCFGLFSLVD